ncbi:hypothetical protein MRB56_22505 [Halomonas cupida]|uniref:hypothetical protein n=1 Tax=Halomonas cupida TaxID=44933 RepID=UPI0039B58221
MHPVFIGIGLVAALLLVRSVLRYRARIRRQQTHWYARRPRRPIHHGEATPHSAGASFPDSGHRNDCAPTASLSGYLSYLFVDDLSSSDDTSNRHGIGDSDGSSFSGSGDSGGGGGDGGGGGGE